MKTPALRTLSSHDETKAVKWSLSYSYFACFIIIGLALSSLGPTLQMLSDQTGTSLSQISYLFMSRSLGYIIGAIFSGWILDKYPAHFIMGITLLCMSCLLFFIPEASLLWTLIAIMAFLGSAESVVDIGGNAMLIRVHRSEVAPFMNSLHFFFGVGGLLAPLLVGLMIQQSLSIAWIYRLISIAIIPVAIWILSLPTPALILKETKASETKTPNRLLLSVILLFLLIYVGFESSVGGWIFTYGTESGISNLAQAAYLTSLYWAAFTIGRLVSIGIVLRYKLSLILLVNLAGVLVCVSALFLVQSSLTALSVLTVGIGFFVAPIFPTIFSFSEKHIVLNSRITGILFFFGSLGSLSFPWLIGQSIEPYGAQSFLYFLLFMAVACIVLLFLILYLSRHRIGSGKGINY